MNDTNNKRFLYWHEFYMLKVFKKSEVWLPIEKPKLDQTIESLYDSNKILLTIKY